MVESAPPCIAPQHQPHAAAQAAAYKALCPHNNKASSMCTLITHSACMNRSCMACALLLSCPARRHWAVTGLCVPRAVGAALLVLTAVQVQARLPGEDAMSTPQHTSCWLTKALHGISTNVLRHDCILQYTGPAAKQTACWLASTAWVCHLQPITAQRNNT